MAISKPLKLKRPVIAITGSAGKTTTKEMIASVLRQRFVLFKTPRNGNHYADTARYAEMIRKKHKAFVLEYGMSRPGRIKRHCLRIQPNLGVITNVGTAHIGNFKGSIDGIARAKSELIRYMHPKGLLILNADDQGSKLLRTKGFQGKVVTVGIEQPADYQARQLETYSKGSVFQVSLNGNMHTFRIPMHGRHNVYNALCAIGVAKELGLHPEEISRGLRRFKKAKSRLETKKLGNRILLIDDSFSSNLEAAKAAIDVLAQMERERRIAVLGTMLETGKLAGKHHRDLGKYAAEQEVDLLFTYGAKGRRIGEGAKAAGMSSSRIRHYATLEGLLRGVRRYAEGSAILIKGSHQLRMDRLAAALKRIYGLEKGKKPVSE